jgi:hypothetical protein
VKIARTSVLTATIFAALAVGFGSRDALLAPPQAHAQNLGQRVVSGAVLSEESEAVIGATVFLKNQKTKAIRSYTTTDKGHFYFAQVNMTDDYDLWAEKSGKKSTPKTVSSWDTRKEFVSDLKLK